MTEVSNWQKHIDALADQRQREQTAATILAALVVRGAPLEEADNLAATATLMADALRAELAKGGK